MPEGMKRVGYDADTQKYYFRDENGDLWEGPEGQEYGVMTKCMYGFPSGATEASDIGSVLQWKKHRDWGW